MLFFAGLFALYATYRIEHPTGFGEGVLHNTLALGSTNTAVLLVSSYTIALAVHQLRRGKTRAAAVLTAATLLLGLCFLAIKTTEYVEHFHEGIYPGGVGAFFPAHRVPGIEMFFTLYFCMTGLHALHVIAGMCVLGLLLRKIVRGRDPPLCVLSPRHRRRVLAPGRRRLDLSLASLLPRSGRRPMSTGGVR